MPVVLMQRVWQDDPKYKDTEFVVYHYPERYFDVINGGESFLYYRPAKGAPRGEASSYFGCGELGDVFDDPFDATHRYVGIRKPIRFPRPVPFTDAAGRMYESRFPSPSSFQGRSIRYIDRLDFDRILISAGLTGSLVADAPTIDNVMAGTYSALSTPPTYEFRSLVVVPEGTGYIPSGAGPDVQESAALQERARADHQKTLRMLKQHVEARGGDCLFNNNVDLLARLGDRRYLVEVKSLNNPASSVDRMRYGMGQLFDYSVRYRARLGNAQPVLAFGTMPSRDVSWISEILQGNGVAFVAREFETVRPMNELARQIPIFQ